MRTAPGIPKWDNSARDVSAQPSPQKLLSHWPIRELGRGRGVGVGGEGSRRGGGEGRGERFSVWSCSRSARAVSPGSSRRETFLPGDARTHSAPPRAPYTLAPLLAHTHTFSLAKREPLTILQVPGPAAARWAPTLRVPIRGLRVGDHDEWRRWAQTSARRGALVGPPGWQSRSLGPARASAESRIKRSSRSHCARRMGTPLFPAL